MTKAPTTSAMVPKFDSYYLDAIKASGVAETTKEQYIKCWKRLQRICDGKTIDYIMHHPKQLRKHIEKHIPNEGTRKTTINTILATFKYIGTVKSGSESYLEWYLMHTTLKNKLEEEAKDSIPKGRAAEGYIEWQDALAAEKQLADTQYGSRDHLCLAMYTHLAPRRQEDYYRTLIVTTARMPPIHGYSAILNLYETPPTLKVLQYKTVKTYDAWEKKLESPRFDSLLKIIKHSLREQPRQVLFAQADGTAYTLVESFTKFTNRVIKKHLGDKVTLNSIRHAASKASLTNANKSLREQEQYAKDMGHSFTTHQLYRFKRPDSDVQ